ncbi:MAG: AHH domain-containing protein [Bacteroidales bacterium]|nr:AHH domain-containing protein [Bacteroidales bacterium]
MRSSPPTGEQRRLKAVILRKQAAQDTVVAQSIDFGIRLLPLVGAVSDFLDGNYTESAISLAGDVAMLTGFGVALKARRCVVTAKDLTKIVYRTSTAVEAGITGFRLGQGVNAYANDDTAAAYRYFGDATLRLLGLSAQSVAWLKNKPKCFVAGTLVHTVEGTKPIEEVTTADQVWAFDRQTQQWRLCRVLRTFENMSAGGMATVCLSTGDTITGTDGHAVWVIEGDDLTDRGRPDHGADEPPGSTLGRWVPLGALRVNDRVLTRSGVAQVVDVDLFTDRVPVFNLEVEGLHSYAVGTAGLLAHNSDPCNLGEVSEAAERVSTHQVAKAPDAPQVTVNNAGAAPTTTSIGGTQGVTNGIDAPNTKTVSPAAKYDGAVDQPDIKIQNPTANHTKSPIKGTRARDILAENLGPNPYPVRAEAHHIFGVELFDTPLGKRLHSWGIDLNSPANGVWLPRHDYAGRVASIHRGRTASAYTNEVVTRLNVANNKDEALEIR